MMPLPSILDDSMRTTLLLAALLACATASATAPAPKTDPAKPEAEAPSPADTAFNARWTEAMKALGTPEGAAYDEQVGKYLVAIPEYKATIHECMTKNPGKQTVTGFLEYDAKGYRVTFRPENGFSACLKRFIEGRELPKPPRVPFVIPMSFTSQD